MPKLAPTTKSFSRQQSGGLKTAPRNDSARKEGSVSSRGTKVNISFSKKDVRK